jgi:hypothetical protein
VDHAFLSGDSQEVFKSELGTMGRNYHHHEVHEDEVDCSSCRDLVAQALHSGDAVICLQDDGVSQYSLRFAFDQHFDHPAID